MKKQILTAILLIITTHSFAQVSTQPNTPARAKYQTEIAMDLTLPDFDTKGIDSTVMGPQLADVLDYLLENYHQTVYNRQLAQILKEQEPSLEYADLYLTKIQFLNAKKEGDEINIWFTVWLAKNSSDIKKINLVFRFKGGVSDSQETNELFGDMSKFVQRRE